MAKRKTAEVNATKAKTPKRTGRAISLWLDPSVAEAMDRFRETFEFKPEYTAIINNSLREYLEKRGVRVAP